MEYIDAFFNEGLSAERKEEFEQRIASDPVFAEEVAFYLSSKQAASDEKNAEREKFKHLINPGNQATTLSNMNRRWCGDYGPGQPRRLYW